MPFYRFDYVVSNWTRYTPMLLEPFLELRHLTGTLNLDVQLDVLSRPGDVKLLEPTKACEPTTSSFA